MSRMNRWLGIHGIIGPACCMFMVWCAIVGAPARAQLSTASINGTVRDSTGSLVPEATLTLRNTETGVEKTTISNSSGNYAFVSIPPGNYTLAVNKAGFTNTTLQPFTLLVNQTATFDFALNIGAVQQSVTVEAVGAAVESSTAELGAVVQRQQVVDLPLNGRNFTQLLSLTPGVSPVSVAQNSGGFGASTTTGSAFTFPSINGQTNRSNYYMLDGINNQGNMVSTYGLPPIIDTVLEFKVQSHNDQAEFGQVLGGVVNIVSRSGTNEFHGTAWEFLRNDALDARNTFLPEKTPFRQNQFGIAGGGPVILPKYNGKNKTFFYAGYQGFRFRQPASSLYRVPTAANLEGDLSDDSRQIYNPFTTRPDPNNPGQFIRDPFPRNQIPASLIDPGMLLYAKTVVPQPNFSGVADLNARDNTPFKQDETEWTVKMDQMLGTKDSVWFRYSNSSNKGVGSGGMSTLASTSDVPSNNWGLSYIHTFGPSAVLQMQYGHVRLDQNSVTRFRNLPADFDQQVGFADFFAKNWYGYSGALIPGVSVANFFGGGEGNSLEREMSNIHEGKANVSKIVGSHTLKWGGEMASNGWDALANSSNVGFDTPQTANPSNPAGTGNELASFLLSVPDTAKRYNGHETIGFGAVMGFYFQDQWKATPKLTVNLGLRYDLTLRPRFGSPGRPGDENRGLDTGDYDFSNGNYILQNHTPFCSERGHAPCIPGDALPAHVVYAKGNIIQSTYDNWQPRLGLAYRLDQNTAIRASFGMYFDNWAGIWGDTENLVGTWPDVGVQIASNLNNQLNVSPVPTVKGTNPFPHGVEGLFPDPTPFEQVTWYTDPHIRNPYSMQWNFGIQHQLNNSTVVNLNYVGSGSRRLEIGGYYNTALTPGPGNPRDREPFPWAVPTIYDRSWGRSNYHALQFLLDKKFNNGLAYMVAYTWSKAINIGSDGYYGTEGQGVQDPYHFNNDRSVAGTDLTHVLSINSVYELPVGPGKRFRPANRVLDYIIGNWQVNAIATFRSGIPFTLRVPGDLANTGNARNYLRPNYIGGKTTLSDPTRNEWFNIAAFAVPPPFTYGNVGRNVMRADGVANFDLSFFRDFPIRERLKLEFRSEMFNAFNSPVYGTPNTNILSSSFGAVTSTANTPRQIQMALKVIF